METAAHAHNTAMGNSGVALPSEKYLNTLNPASLSNLDSLSFYFNFQAQGTSNKFIMSGKEQTNFDSNFDILSMGFGLLPGGECPWVYTPSQVWDTRLTPKATYWDQHPNTPLFMKEAEAFRG